MTKNYYLCADFATKIIIKNYNITMAVLGKIRSHSVALLIIVGLAMLAFILGDILTSSSQISQSRRDKVVTINGQKVTYEQFETARQQRTEFYKTLMGREADGDATQQITQEVYNQFVTNALLDDICEDYGITVTKEELSELVQGDNLSPILQSIFGQQAKMISQLFVQLENSGEWEMAAQQYGTWASKANWDFLKEQIIQARKVEKFQSLLAAAIKPNKLEAEDYYNGDNTDYTFAFVRQTAGQVADSLVSVKNDDLKKYFESNKRLWKIAGQRRTIDYIAVPLRPSQEDFAEAEKEINDMRDEFATTDDVADLVNGNSIAPYADAFVAVRDLDEETREFVEANEAGAILEPHRTQGTYFMMARILDKTTAPDSLEISMVVVPTQVEADSLQTVLNAGNEVTGYSNQQAFKGWISDLAALQTFGPEIRDAILATAKDQTIVKSVNNGQQNVYYTIKVTDKTAPVAKAKVAVYATEVIPSTTTRRNEYGKLNQFLTANKTIKQMEDSAITSGYAMIPTTLSATSYNVGQVADARQAVRFAFTGDKGDISEIFEAGDNLLVLAITGEIEEGFQSLNDSVFAKQIRARVLPSKKVDYLKEQFAAVSGNDLEAYAQKFNAKVDTAKFANFNSRSIIGLGTEPAIVEAAIKAGVNNVTVATGRNTVAAVKLLSSDAKNNEYNEEQVLSTLARSQEYSQAVNGALSALQYAAEIEDNRISFY